MSGGIGLRLELRWRQCASAHLISQGRSHGIRAKNKSPFDFNACPRRIWAIDFLLGISRHDVGHTTRNVLKIVLRALTT